MSFSNDWTITNNPADHTQFQAQPGFVRKVRQDIQDRLASIIYGFTSGETDIAFKQILAKAQASDPSLPDAGFSTLYTKVVSGKAEWFIQTEDGTITQLTSLGKILANALVLGGGTLGDIFYIDASLNLVRLPGNITTTKQFLSQTGTGTISAVPAWVAGPATAKRGTFRNLTMSNNGSNQATVTADELIVQDTGGNGVTIQSFNKTMSSGGSGAGGISTGAVAANKIYNLWAVRKSSDGTTALVAALTTKALSDVLTDIGNSYDQGALVSVIGTNNSANIIPSKQTDYDYFFTAWGIAASGNVGTGTWVSINLKPANMTTNPFFVPTGLSNLVLGSAYDANGVNIIMTNDNSVAAGNTLAPNKYLFSTASRLGIGWELEVLTTDTIYWGSDEGNATIYVRGFRLNKL